MMLTLTLGSDIWGELHSVGYLYQSGSPRYCAQIETLYLQRCYYRAKESNRVGEKESRSSMEFSPFNPGNKLRKAMIKPVAMVR